MSASRESTPFQYDLYISYASVDNDPAQGTGPWVSQFVTRLQSTLEMRMGTAPRVWYAWSPPEGELPSSSLPQMAFRALHSSALFVSVMSPAYLVSTRCIEELQSFVAGAGPERVVKVMKAPGHGAVPLPASPQYEFFRSTPRGTEALVDQPYYAVLNQIASQVRVLLGSLAKSAPAAAPRQTKMEVFLCHSSGDKAAVRKLWERLREDGFAPWLDEKELLPGQRWEMEIQNAIDRAGAIIVCLSSGSVNKEGYVQREIKLVLDKAGEMPDDSIFLIPARLEECAVPRRLGELQWVDLFHETGYERLLQALGMRARQALNR